MQQSNSNLISPCRVGLSRRLRAFTLIELLIVVAIIAILAAIAAPNFLEAQVRAKVSRAVSDMHTIAGALEAYALDYSDYPPNNPEVYSTTPSNLTTPVAFLTNNILLDPFATNKEHVRYGEAAQWYTYGRVVAWNGSGPPPMPQPPVEVFDSPIGNHGAMRKYGQWRLASLGPDLTYSDNIQFNSDMPLYGADIPYNPTNGTKSWGNILRTQRHPDGPRN